MKKLLYITNIPSPYRVQFFDLLGQYMDVTVLLTEQMEGQGREMSWYQKNTSFRMVQLEKRAARMHGEDLCLDVVKWLSKSYDNIIIGGYSSPTLMLAIAYMKCRRIPFYMEIDGGVLREESRPLYLLKKTLVKSADAWISSGEYPTEYLVHYGAKREKIFRYPLSSLRDSDILPEPVSQQEREALREKLHVSEERMVLSIGQFIPRKGFDILLESARKLGPDVGIYIVGGEPTEEYLNYKTANNLNHVHFVGFQNKASLAQYYKAADLFVLPTREDIWGLVINEAMAYGLSVITTDRCVAGLELVEDGVNGYLIPVENADILAERIQTVLQGDFRSMGCASLEKIRTNTIEKMVEAHLQILGE